MSWVGEMFEAVEARERVMAREDAAFRELAPVFITELRREVRARVDDFNSHLTRSGRGNSVQPNDIPSGIELMFRRPVPMYSIRVSADTETLSAWSDDTRMTVLKLTVSDDRTALETENGAGLQEAAMSLLMPYFQAVSKARS